MDNLNNPTPPAAQEKKGAGDFLLTGFLAIALFTIISQNIIQNLIPEWYTGVFKYILTFIWIVSSLSYLFIPFAMRRSGIRVVGLILTVILVIFMLVQNIRFLIS